MPDHGGQAGKDEVIERPLVGEMEIAVETPEKINENVNAPLIFSESPASSEAVSTLKMKYAGRDKGRQRKYYDIIALLEMYHAKDTRLWSKLDEQMQRYFKREYPEYFERDNKEKRKKRENNKAKATRIRHERLQREVRGAAAAHTGKRVAPLDFSAWSNQVSGR